MVRLIYEGRFFLFGNNGPTVILHLDIGLKSSYPALRLFVSIRFANYEDLKSIRSTENCKQTETAPRR